MSTCKFNQVFLAFLFLLTVRATAVPNSSAEVYILGGQSNMEGQARLTELSEPDSHPVTNVFIWHGNDFVPYAPGYDHRTQRKFGPELGFARELSRSKPGVQIYLIKYAVGGMPLHPGWNGNKWEGGSPAPGRVNFYPGKNADDSSAGKLYLNLRDTTRKAVSELNSRGVAFKICGLLWMQGEQDSKNEASATDYPWNLHLLKRRLAEDLGLARLPLYYGQVLPYTPPLERFTDRNVIRARMAAADSRSGRSESIPDAFMISTDSMPVGDDHVHYNAEGQLKLGGAFADAVLRDSQPLDPRIGAVWLAQTHVMQPDQPYFKLTGNRETLLKADVISPGGGPSPEVFAVIVSGSETNTLQLKGPKNLPRSLPSEPGRVQHRFEDSFTGIIPAKWVRKGLEVEIHAGSSPVHRKVSVGAPTVVNMKMFDVHYFGRGTNDYPKDFFKELEAKWPVAGLEIERVRGINFPELVIPARDKLPAVRIESPEDYQKKTGAKFDGEQAAALQWVWALSRAGGNRNVAMCYINILGVSAGGQAGGFNGVGTIRLGIMNHELGHALSLPHIGEQKNYPYRGEMFGIRPPKVFNEVHVGPTWAFDLPTRTFIPPTVQRGSTRWPAGQYKADPMQGGGDGDQEEEFLLRHFSDYNVRRMQAYLEGHVAIRRDGNYYKWDDGAGAYTQKVENDGVKYPVAQDVPVFSAMAAMTMLDLDVNMVYPPIGPYRGNLIRTFDPRSKSDRALAQRIFSPKGGCDFTLRIAQGGKESLYLLPASAADEKNLNVMRDLTTAAVNVRADAGQITSVELLYTPKADQLGVNEHPRVLARWPKGQP